MIATPQTHLERDLRTLALFIALYCRRKHAGALKTPFQLKTHDIQAIAGKPVSLCNACRKLLAHALVKRSHCPLQPKPACKHCPVHCYHPNYREQIQEVMKYSGRQMVLAGRLDFLFHLLF
jgi:hypothetical protein